MNKGKVGEDRGSKETDGCPLTHWRCITSYWWSLKYQSLYPLFLLPVYMQDLHYSDACALIKPI
jgi:hypothetical protein